MNYHKLLDLAQLWADANSGCKKVSVGSVILSDDGKTLLSVGANRAMPDLCKARECMRVEKYGEDSKSHRLPEDCRAIHSEIDAICNAAKNGVSLHFSCIVVTRYPCESCAKAIVSAGIRSVAYGGTATISDQTRELFERNGVYYTHIKDWKEDLTDR